MKLKGLTGQNQEDFALHIREYRVYLVGKNKLSDFEEMK